MSVIRAVVRMPARCPPPRSTGPGPARLPCARRRRRCRISRPSPGVQPAASFFDRIEAVISGIDSTVAVTSRMPYSRLSAGARSAVWPMMAHPALAVTDRNARYRARCRIRERVQLVQVPPVWPSPRPGSWARSSRRPPGPGPASTRPCRQRRRWNACPRPAVEPGAGPVQNGAGIPHPRSARRARPWSCRGRTPPWRRRRPGPR